MLRVITVNVKLLCDHESLLWQFTKIKNKKNKIFFPRLIPFRVSRVSGAHQSPRLCPRYHTSKVAAVVSHWQGVEDLIGSGFV